MQNPPVRAWFALCLVPLLLAGCSTNPVTGRDQIVAIPAAQAHAELGFALSNGPWRRSAAQPCAQACRDEDPLAKFTLQVALASAELENAARSLSPEAMNRIESFRVSVEPGLGVATGSSASGRIALGSAIAQFEPTEDVIAFLIAREMAHVIARHDEEDSGARIFSSALTTFIPGFSLMVKFFASTLGGGALMGSWAAEQRREADEIAIALLERAGRSATAVAQSLASGMKQDKLPDGEWAKRYTESVTRVALLAELPPRYAEFGD